MNPILELLLGEIPDIINAFRRKLPPGTTPAEVIAAFEQAFTDSDMRDAILIAALKAEMRADD